MTSAGSSWASAAGVVDDGAVGVADADVVDFDVLGAGGEGEGEDAEALTPAWLRTWMTPVISRVPVPSAA